MNPRDPLLEPQARERRVIRVLRERWYVVALVAGACLAGALAIALGSSKQYQATSKLLFQQDSFGAALFGQNVFSQDTDPTRTSQTNVDSVSSLSVANAVRARLHLSASGQDLLNTVSATAEPNADIVDITVTDSDPDQAARIANSWAYQFIGLRQLAARNKVGQAIADMRAKLAGLPADAGQTRAQYIQQLSKLQALQAVQFGDVQLSDVADVPKSPTSPQPKRDAVLGLLLGLALGVAFALLLDALDRRIKTVDALESAYDRPVIGLVPERAIRPRTEADRRKSIEAFRAVREGLSVFTVTKSSPVFVVTSAISAEGKTTVAINLSRVLAMSGERVVLIEADLRRPTLDRHTGIPHTQPGLTTALLHETPLTELLMPDRTGLENLRILPSAASVPFAAELLRSPKMAALLDEARKLADVVIIDSPPLLPVADTRSLINNPAVDGVLLVARLGVQTTEQAKRVRGLLEQLNIQEALLIATGAPEDPDYGYDAEYVTGTSATAKPSPLAGVPGTSSPPRLKPRPVAQPAGRPRPAAAPRQAPDPAPQQKPQPTPQPVARPVPPRPASPAPSPPRPAAPAPAAPAANGAPAGGTVPKPRQPFRPTRSS